MLPLIEAFGLQIYTYPLIIGMIWGIFYHVGKNYIQHEKAIAKKYNLFLFLLFVSSWFGAKVLYLLTLNLDLVKKVTISTSFWLGGGFVFYGGLIFGTIFVFIFARTLKIELKKFSFLVPLVCLGHGIGRIACFLAGCCYGIPSESFWSVFLHGDHRHPVQLYESFLLLLMFIYFHEQYKNKKEGLILKYLTSYSIIRFSLEFIRGDKYRGENLLFFLSTSQLISILIIVVLGLYLTLRAKRHD